MFPAYLKVLKTVAFEILDYFLGENAESQTKNVIEFCCQVSSLWYVWSKI